jgi:hypothetical protein
VENLAVSLSLRNNFNRHPHASHQQNCNRGPFQSSSGYALPPWATWEQGEGCGPEGLTMQFPRSTDSSLFPDLYYLNSGGMSFCCRLHRKHWQRFSGVPQTDLSSSVNFKLFSWDPVSGATKLKSPVKMNCPTQLSCSYLRLNIKDLNLYQNDRETETSNR